jgi:hypothetical protein
MAVAPACEYVETKGVPFSTGTKPFNPFGL